MFGQLGEMAGLMKKVGEMQSKMKQIKTELAEMEVSGESANGTVKIVLAGDFSAVKSVHITGGSGMELERAVGEALSNALNNVRTASASRLSEVTGGLNLPGLGL